MGDGTARKRSGSVGEPQVRIRLPPADEALEYGIVGINEGFISTDIAPSAA
jgi:hypothetical protein